MITLVDYSPSENRTNIEDIQKHYCLVVQTLPLYLPRTFIDVHCKHASIHVHESYLLCAFLVALSYRRDESLSKIHTLVHPCWNASPNHLDQFKISYWVDTEVYSENRPIPVDGGALNLHFFYSQSYTGTMDHWIPFVYFPRNNSPRLIKHKR